ncbi:hypothetical protein FRB90_008571 [Tulasnella sp. 427]|nr:hypothetical protein FRB90_008571 [Tulasnella sp. 427]
MSESDISVTDSEMQDGGVVRPMIPTTLSDNEQALARALSVSEVYERTGHSVIENPSKDIRTDLENIMTNDLKFGGAFYYNKTYTDAPNPVLRLKSLGRIGLPLSEREAKHIAANSRQAPFGMGERTLVDKEVRDTWEMPGAEVFFDNPNWNGFINQITNEVCARLGVNIRASQPRVELYKLLLYETGSHFLAHRDSEKVDGMFATIIIILPSTFTGGTVHLSHAGQKAVVNENKDSFFNTTVLAWYTDVVHEIKPIESGYRLALSYTLVHTTKSLRPVLTDTSEPIAKIRHVLLSWRQNLNDDFPPPKKIIYLLEHKYSAANCNGSAMKGKDAHVVAVLESICSDIGFRLGLALIECYVKEEAYDEEDWTRTMKITKLVSLDGVLLKEDLELEEKDENSNKAEFIPCDLRVSVERGPIDEEETEGYHGNEADTYHRWYRRTVFVLWPEELDEEVLDGSIYLRHAMKTLADTTSIKPTASEMRFFQYGLRKRVEDLRKEDKLNVLRSLCTAACRWNEPDLWTKAMSTFLGYEISMVLEKEQKNKGRLELLHFLESELRAKNASTDWIVDVRNTVINSLRPLSEDDIKPLLELCRDLGGVILLEKTILPQLRCGHEPEQLVKLSATIFEEMKSPQASMFQSTDDKATGTRLVKEFLSLAIECADLFEGGYTRQKLSKEEIEDYRNEARRWTPWHVNPKLAVTLIRNCLTTENEGLIDDIVTKLTFQDFDNAILGPKNRAEKVLFPLVKQVQELVMDRKASASIPLEIQRLYREVPQLMLAKEDLKEDDIATILRVAADDSRPAVILQRYAASGILD